MNIYTMPGLVPKAQVGGFSEPVGECADRSGNIWVVDFVAKTITKLTHTGEIAGVLKDRNGSPWSCAIDPTTGNLAVTDIFATGGPGNVVIYANAGGSGKMVTNPQQFLYTFDAYDSHGDLWVDGTDTGSNFILSSCGASSCSTITVTGPKIYDGVFLQWAASEKKWYLGADNCGGNVVFCVYPVSSRGALGTPITFTDPRGGTVCHMMQGVITNAASSVLAGGTQDANCYKVNNVATWKFPAGGDPTHDTFFVGQPWGAALSRK